MIDHLDGSNMKTTSKSGKSYVFDTKQPSQVTFRFPLLLRTRMCARTYRHTNTHVPKVILSLSHTNATARFNKTRPNVRCFNLRGTETSTQTRKTRNGTRVVVLSGWDLSKISTQGERLPPGSEPGSRAAWLAVPPPCDEQGRAAADQETKGFGPRS